MWQSLLALLPFTMVLLLRIAERRRAAPPADEPSLPVFSGNAAACAHAMDRLHAAGIAAWLEPGEGRDCTVHVDQAQAADIPMLLHAARAKRDECP